MGPRIGIAAAGLLVLAGVLVPTARSAEKDVWLALGPASYRNTLEPLLLHRRSQGYSAAFLPLGSILADGEDSAEAVRRAVRRLWEGTGGRLRFLLLVGDAGPVTGEEGPGAHVPLKLLEPRFTDDRFPRAKIIASDVYYGMMDDDSVPDIRVGRFPADTAEELAVMVRKTIDYEKSRDFGQWRRRINLIAGTGGFGPAADAMIESMFRKFVGELLHPGFEVVLTYANPRSPYCFPPPRFRGKVVDLINRGSLVTAYVGHGMPHSFDRLRFAGRRYEVFSTRSAGEVSVRRGSPLMVIIACSTGHTDHPEADAISEVLMKNPKGPVAVYASSRISHPYANGLIGRLLIEHLMSPGGAPTLGEALNAVCRGLVEHAPDPLNRMIDGFAGMLLNPDDLPASRLDHVHLYNLLGDPALRPGHPAVSLALEAPARARAGEEILVAGDLGETLQGPATVWLTPPRGVPLRPAQPLGGLTGEPLLRRMEQNWEKANDAVLARASTRADGSSFRLALRIPQRARGPAWIRVYVEGETGAALGAVRIEIEPAEKEDEGEGDDF
jgi:hypothetical protein